jgi:choline dehydrogenase-like flavoprotein
MSTPTPTTVNEEYDIIIAGGMPSPLPPFFSFLTESTIHAVLGGTAGCVVASRLATADPDLRILVLEAGPSTHDNPAHIQPAFFISHLAPGSRTVRAHAGRPSEALGGRSAIVQTGQCLGGGGSVNCASSLFALFVSRMRRLTGEACVDGWIVVRFWIRI